MAPQPIPTREPAEPKYLAPIVSSYPIPAIDLTNFIAYFAVDFMAFSPS